MSFTGRALRVRNFRYGEEWMMMVMGGWIATMPELRCGRRTVDASPPATDGFAALIKKIAELEVLDQLCDTDDKCERRQTWAEEVRSLLAECGGVTGVDA